MTKQELRKEIREQRDGLSVMDREARSTEIREHLLSSVAYQQCKSIFPYLSFQSEVDTVGIIRHALSEGKRVYLPRVNKDGLEFYEIWNMEELQVSNYGILEPKEMEITRYTGPQTLASPYERLMLLPGLAFDTKGNRIGYGAGYYDRYLAAHHDNEFYKIGLAYEIQLINFIPSDTYDIRVDEILTPTGFLFGKY